MAGFFNKLFPNWHPKTIVGKILKGATVVVSPIASALGAKNTAILAAATIGAVTVGPTVVAGIGSAVKGGLKLLSTAKPTIDSVNQSVSATAEMLKQKSSDSEYINAAYNAGVINKSSDGSFTLNPIIYIFGAVIALILIAGRE